MNKETHQDPDLASIWDNVAEINYDMESYWKSPENRAILYELLSYIENPKNKKIIEVGCGSGYVSLELAKKGSDVSLLDISSISLKKAVQSFLDQGLPEPTHYNEDALNSNVPSDYFDIVWNGGVIEHFSDEGKEILIKEMLRMTKPGGKVIILVPNRWCIQFQIMQAWMKLRKTWIYGKEDDMSPRRLKKMCERMGITNFNTYAFNPMQGWIWVPIIGQRVIQLLGGNTLENHQKRTMTGFNSVLVITKH